MRVGVLYNPLSGRLVRHPNLIHNVLSVYGNLQQAQVKTPQDIVEALRTFAHHHVTLLIIIGGDGTLQATLDALFNDRPFQTMPHVAIMPGGTANLVAGDVGTGPLHAQSLRALLAKAGSLSREFSFVKRPILRVQFPDNRMPLHGMFFGAGAIYQGTKIGLETKQGIGRMGEWGAGLIMVRSMLALAMGSPQDLGPVTATLSVVEGKASEHEYLVVLVSTLERLFLGLKPFWSDQDGALHYTSLRIPYRYLWRVLPKVLRGNPHPLAIGSHGYESKNVSMLQIGMKSGFVLDGEIHASPTTGESMTLDSAGELSFIQVAAEAS